MDECLQALTAQQSQYVHDAVLVFAVTAARAQVCFTGRHQLEAVKRCQLCCLRCCLLLHLSAGIDEAQHSQYVLIEQLNFHEMRKEGLVPQKVVEQLVWEKVKREPVMVMLFDRQGAAAVVMPDAETAVQLR
jgi:hypothetical protein